MRRRRFLIERLEGRHFGRGRQQIIGECGGDRLAGIVVAHPFEHGIADAMRNAAVDLALDDLRIDPAAGILDRDIAQDGDAAGLDVDLDLDDVAGI